MRKNKCDAVLDPYKNTLRIAEVIVMHTMTCKYDHDATAELPICDWSQMYNCKVKAKQDHICDLKILKGKRDCKGTHIQAIHVCFLYILVYTWTLE